MSKGHKDLPGGSQDWANDVDKAMKEVARLTEVIRRLTENAGMDMSNPRRGVNAATDIPSAKNPVGQKLSSLADTDTYNVLDGQVLSWSGKGQRWLPITLPTATGGGAIEIPMSYSSTVTGYGQIDSPYGFFAYTGTNPGGDAELWGSNGSYVGSGDWSGDESPGYTLLEQGRDGFSRPYLRMTAEDYVADTYTSLELSSFGLTLNGAYFVPHRCTTANRPTGLGTGTTYKGAIVFDLTLGIHISWNGTGWTNLLGTPV